MLLLRSGRSAATHILSSWWRYAVGTSLRGLTGVVWLAPLLFVVSMTPSPCHAADWLMSNKYNATQRQVLGLFGPRSSDVFSSREASTPVAMTGQAGATPAATGRAERILARLWLKRKDDPFTLSVDIQQLARYIAGQPSAMQLLLSLENQPLRLRYRAGDFSTTVRGSAFSVHGVTVYFDPRSAAQLDVGSTCREAQPRCIASPADAFLHELLHAKIALLETERFIASGAMQAMLYPFAHEREVISREQKMYADMTRRDLQPRPQRQSHTGHLIAADCVTCVGS